MEMIDIINDEDEVIGQASLDDIYMNNHAHRIVHVLFQNAAGALALQLRGSTESFCPGHWGTTVGGHVQAGESFEVAARRECEEEVGVSVPELVPLGKYQYEYLLNGKPMKKMIQVFRADAAVDLSPASEEGDAIKFVLLEDIQSMVDKGEKFMPELVFILEKEFGITC